MEISDFQSLDQHFENKQAIFVFTLASSFNVRFNLVCQV